MPINPSTLLARQGPVTIALLAGDADAKSFGKKEALAALTEYVDAAYLDDRVSALAGDEGTQDKAARALALYRIYNDAYVGMLNRPATLAVTDKGSHAYTSEQIKGMKAIADGYLAEFDNLLPSPPEGSAQRETTVHAFLTF